MSSHRSSGRCDWSDWSDWSSWSGWGSGGGRGSRGGLGSRSSRSSRGGRKIWNGNANRSAALFAKGHSGISITSVTGHVTLA